VVRKQENKSSIVQSVLKLGTKFVDRDTEVKGGVTNLNVGVNVLEGGEGGKTVKALTFEEGDKCMTLPPQLLW